MGRGGPNRGKSGQNGLNEPRWVVEDHGEAEMALKELRQIRSRYGEADCCRGGADRGKAGQIEVRRARRSRIRLRRVDRIRLRKADRGRGGFEGAEMGLDETMGDRGGSHVQIDRTEMSDFEW
jgi:hypothetical protein